MPRPPVVVVLKGRDVCIAVVRDTICMSLDPDRLKSASLGEPLLLSDVVGRSSGKDNGQAEGEINQSVDWSIRRLSWDRH